MYRDYTCGTCGTMEMEFREADRPNGEFPPKARCPGCGGVAFRQVAVPRVIGPVFSNAEDWASRLGVSPQDPRLAQGSRGLDALMAERNLRAMSDAEVQRNDAAAQDLAADISRRRAEGARNEDPSVLQKHADELKLQEVLSTQGRTPDAKVLAAVREQQHIQRDATMMQRLQDLSPQDFIQTNASERVFSQQLTNWLNSPKAGGEAEFDNALRGVM